MNKKPGIHVTHRASGEWAVIREGAQRASSLHGTQTEAVSIARDLSRRDGAELLIHGENNRIRARDSHGNDPRRSKG